MSKMDQLQQALGYSFKDIRLLERALTHSSHSHERLSRKPEDYERFEFLGDALLGFLVADWLFKDDEFAAEGVLSRRRQSAVRASTLAAAARRLGLGESILLGKGEELTGGRGKASLLADLFEAVLGAVYLDGGIRPARAFVRRHLGGVLRESRSSGGTADDFKTRLQERTQADLQLTPRYRIVAATGPAHARNFLAEVVVGDSVLGGGEGQSRKHAEQEAARMALLRLEETGG
jgi:ribonuclease-3